MVKPTTTRLVLCLIVSQGWSLLQLDVKKYLLTCGFLCKDVYMSQPIGFANPSFLLHFCNFIRLPMVSNKRLELGFTVEFLSMVPWISAKPGRPFLIYSFFRASVLCFVAICG